MQDHPDSKVLNLIHNRTNRTDHREAAGCSSIVVFFFHNIYLSELCIQLVYMQSSEEFRIYLGSFWKGHNALGTFRTLFTVESNKIILLFFQKEERSKTATKKGALKTDGQTDKGTHKVVTQSVNIFLIDQLIH